MMMSYKHQDRVRREDEERKKVKEDSILVLGKLERKIETRLILSRHRDVPSLLSTLSMRDMRQRSSASPGPLHQAQASAER